MVTDEQGAGLGARLRLAIDLQDVEALRLLAGAEARKGGFADAESLLRQAIDLAPAFVAAYVDLASLHQRLGRPDEMVALLDGVLAKRPEDFWALSLKAAVLEADRRADEALGAHEALLAHASGASVPWTNYAGALNAVGRLGDSVNAYRRAVKLDPANGLAWWGLANLRTVRLDADDVVLMEAALPRAVHELSRCQLHYALGRALGDQGRFESSLRHYETANNLRGRMAPYDATALSALVRRTEAVFTPEFLADRQGQGCADPAPIFIVGMPRSGSTLIEQILASHPMIEGAGELFEFSEIAAAVSGAPADLSADELRALGEQYIVATRRYRPAGRPFFTDKMPANWRHVGLIHLILPNAKIIDVRRQPLACCFSSFSTYFSRATSFPTTLADLAQYYRDYVRMIGHFETAAPGRIHRVSYGWLVEDLEGEVRRLLTHLGLPFDRACLRFHETQREIHTPSAQQVRRPLNRDGLERWRAYEPWLGTLKDGLGGIADADA